MSTPAATRPRALCYDPAHCRQRLTSSGRLAAMTTDAKMINHLWTHKTQDHPFLSDEELVIDRAEGVWVWTERGKKLLDGFAGLAVVNVGHGRREIAEAIAEQTVAGLLPDHAAVLQSPGRGARREAGGAHARRPALHDVRGERVRGQRALDADRPPVLAGRREARQVQGDLAAGRLPRRHHGHLRDLRPAPPVPGLRAARGARLREGEAAASLPRSGGWHRGGAD